jgi:hypothetical protein
MKRRLESIDIAQALLDTNSEDTYSKTLSRKTLGANSRRYSGKLSIILAGPQVDISRSTDSDDKSGGTDVLSRLNSPLSLPGSRRSSVKRNSIKSAPLHTPRKDKSRNNSMSPDLLPLIASKSEERRTSASNNSPAPPDLRRKSETRKGNGSPVSVSQDYDEKGHPFPATKKRNSTPFSVVDGNTLSALQQPKKGANSDPVKGQESAEKKEVRPRTPVTPSDSNPRGNRSPENHKKGLSTSRKDPGDQKKSSDQRDARKGSNSLAPLNPLGLTPPSSIRISTVKSVDPSSSKRNSTVGIDSTSKRSAIGGVDVPSKRNSSVPATTALPMVVKKKEKVEIPRSEILLRHLKSGISFSKLFGTNSKDGTSSLRSSFLGGGSNDRGSNDKGGNDKRMVDELVINENYSEAEGEGEGSPFSGVVDMDKVSESLQQSLKSFENPPPDVETPPTASISKMSILTRESSVSKLLSRDSSVSKLFRSISIKNIGFFKPSLERNFSEKFVDRSNSNPGTMNAEILINSDMVSPKEEDEEKISTKICLLQLNDSLKESQKEAIY